MYTNIYTSVYDSNLGIVDRSIRVVASIALIGAFMAFQSPGTVIYSLMALVALPIAATALMSWDPLYALFGINSKGENMNRRFSESNVGHRDSYVRYGISAAMVFGFMVLAPTPVGWTALIPLLALPVFNTALTGWCPIYTLLQISTRSADERGLLESIVYTGFPGAREQEQVEHGKKAA